jgi:hypothetical protein
MDAICRFNDNGSQCNGWLLKRDLEPESNDNDPVGLEKAASGTRADRVVAVVSQDNRTIPMPRSSG